MTTEMQLTANCQNSNCLTPGVHPKICQEEPQKSKVMTEHSKRLPRHQPQRNLAVLFSGLGILRIESKKRKRPLTRAAFSIFGGHPCRASAPPSTKANPARIALSPVSVFAAAINRRRPSAANANISTGADSAAAP
jgi:hypothetical protein